MYFRVLYFVSSSAGSMSESSMTSETSNTGFYRPMLRRARLCHSTSSIHLSVCPYVCDVQVPWSHTL